MSSEQTSKVEGTLTFVRLAPLDEIPERKAKLFWVDDRPIVVIREEGAVYALHGLCSHQGKPLEGGMVWKGVLDCPWHHFEWDIHTGENLFPKRVYPLERMPHLKEQVRPLRVYPVRVEDGYVEVGLPEE